MKRIFIFFVVALWGLLHVTDSVACTGISLRSTDGSNVVARTVEWAASPLRFGYVVVPRGHILHSYTPKGIEGLKSKAIFGYVGIFADNEQFVIEGINEAGLSAGLFFFSGNRHYSSNLSAYREPALCDMQFVSWALSQFETINQVKSALRKIDIVVLSHKMGAVHWRFTEPSGRSVVLEIVRGVPRFYENKLGVLTDAPGFPWHVVNVDNHSDRIGFPGDFTSSSRFVRAVFFQSTAPQLYSGLDTVLQAFHIMNNFDIPIGVQRHEHDVSEGLLSATQLTSVSDQRALRLYYRTAQNGNIRCIDLMRINFHKVRYQYHPLDDVQVQPVENIRIR